MSLKFLVMFPLAPFLFQTKILKKSPFFQQRLFNVVLFSLVRGERRWSTAVSGLETDLKREVTQEELGKRDTPPGASCRACFQCGGLVGPDVPLPRQRRVCAAPRCAQIAGVDGASPAATAKPPLLVG